MAYTQIANSLNSVGAKRLRTDKPFTIHCVGRILQVEYYVGDVLLQKSTPRDFITKKPIKNIDYDSYYVRYNHQGLIDRDTWEAVKAKLDTETKKRARGIYPVGSNTHFLFGGKGGCNR